jgi:ribA/ribD-fused uncharacterized protein
MTIYFYSTHEVPYGCFSNFSSHGIEMDGHWWPTTEHYFQAQKFAGTPYEEQVRLAATPKQAALIGRDRRLPLRPDWEQVKDEVMRRAVMCKFETYTQLRELLLATGDEEIVERNVRDEYWGCGKEGTGKNMLGCILMEVRAILRKKERTNKHVPDERASDLPTEDGNKREQRDE